MAAFERAAGLTPGTAQRAELTLAAARNAWACGQTTRARALLAAARQHAEDPVLLGGIARLRGGSRSTSARRPTRTGSSSSPPAPSATIDPPRALEMAVAAAIMRTYGADSGAALQADDIDVEVAEADPPRTACLKQMLVAMTRAGSGDWAGAVTALDAALSLGDAVDDLDVLGNLGNAALQLGDDEAQQHFYGLALSRAREAGAVMVVVYALQRLCFGYLVARRLGGGAQQRRRGARARHRRRATGADRPPLAWLTLLAALQGRDDYEHPARRPGRGRRGAPAGHPDRPGPRPDPVGQGGARRAGGDSFGALHHLSRMRLRALARMAAVERIDAAVRAGEPDLARGWVEELAGFADATGRPWALATVAYGRAMTAATQATRRRDALFADALAHHAGAGRPLRRRRAPISRTASGCAAPNAASTPANTCATRWRPSPTCAPRRSPTARPRSCAPPVRPPANGTPPRWSS